MNRRMIREPNLKPTPDPDVDQLADEAERGYDVEQILARRRGGRPPRDTARLHFRPMTDDDLDRIARLLGDPAVMAYYPTPKTREQAQAWIDWNTANYAEHGYGLWVIETLGGEFLGDCGLTWQDVNGHRELEVGYHLRVAAQGRGYATEAAAACRDFARDVLGAAELVAIVHPDNVASQRVAAKIGMRFTVEEHRGAPPVRVIFGMKLRGARTWPSRYRCRCC